MPGRGCSRIWPIWLMQSERRQKSDAGPRSVMSDAVPTVRATVASRRIADQIREHPHLTDIDIAEMDDIQDRIEATSDVEEFLVLDRRLHWTTYVDTTPTSWPLMIARMWDTTHHYRRAHTRLAGAQRGWIINSEHRLLIEAIRDRDVVSAEDIMAMHIRRTPIELAAHPEVFELPLRD
jgi:DNA-binding GntR family transcriptional regulator